MTIFYCIKRVKLNVESINECFLLKLFERRGVNSLKQINLKSQYDF